MGEQLCFPLKEEDGMFVAPVTGIYVCGNKKQENQENQENEKENVAEQLCFSLDLVK